MLVTSFIKRKKFVMNEPRAPEFKYWRKKNYRSIKVFYTNLDTGKKFGLRISSNFIFFVVTVPLDR